MASKNYWNSITARDNLSFVLVFILAATISVVINLIWPLFAAVMFVMFVSWKVYQTVGTERVWRYAKLIIFVGVVVSIEGIYPEVAIIGKILAWFGVTMLFLVLFWGWRRSRGNFKRYICSLFEVAGL